MNAKLFLDDLLKAGRELAEKGQTIVEKKLDIEEPGEKRDATLSGIKTGALAVSAIAVLLGTKTGRQVTGSAIKLGSLAAVGGIAWQAYQNYKNNGNILGDDDKEVVPVNEITDDKEANERSITLLKAMIAAAKSDGHVGADELNEIKKQIDNLGLEGDVASVLEEELAKPLDIEEIAALAGAEEAKAAEIYLVSAVILNKENEKERKYLDDLAKAMNIPDALLAELNAYNDRDDV